VEDCGENYDYRVRILEYYDANDIRISNKNVSNDDNDE